MNEYKELFDKIVEFCVEYLSRRKLEGTPMLGFLGDFSVKFEVPDHWGIGKSVSLEFGTIVRNIQKG
ncbi:MAG: CRISPR-associated endonuclease Cas6 [bacterium]